MSGLAVLIIFITGIIVLSFVSSLFLYRKKRERSALILAAIFFLLLLALIPFSLTALTS